MYILTDSKWNCKKFKIYKETKKTLGKKLTKKFIYSNLKDLIFNKYICKMYILADIKCNCSKPRFI